MANRSREAEKKEVVVRPDQNAAAEAEKLAEGIAALVAGGTDLYSQLMEGRENLGFDPDRLALLKAIGEAELGSEGLACTLVDFREALKALAGVTEIAGLPIDQMQIRVAALGAALKRQELLRRQMPIMPVRVEMNGWKPSVKKNKGSVFGGMPNSLDDARAKGGEMSRQIALRNEVSALEREIALSPYQPGSALEHVLSLPEMGGVFNLAVVYAEAMGATKAEFDFLLKDLIEHEVRLTKKARTAREVANVFVRMEDTRLKSAAQIKLDQDALARLDIRSTDSTTRRDRMNGAAGDIDSLAKAALEYNEAFMATTEKLKQMKSLTLAAVADRQLMDSYLAGLEYLITIYYMQAAGLIHCLSGAALIVGAGMEEYLRNEAKRIMGEVGENLGLVDATVAKVIGDLRGLRQAGSNMVKPDVIKKLEGDVVEGEFTES